MRRIEKAPASAGAFFHVMRGGGIVCRDTNSAAVPRERNFDSAQSGCSAGAGLVVSMFEVVVEKGSQFRGEGGGGGGSVTAPGKPWSVVGKRRAALPNIAASGPCSSSCSCACQGCSRRPAE